MMMATGESVEAGHFFSATNSALQSPEDKIFTYRTMTWALSRHHPPL
jgi:hypothetical protein